MILFLSHYPTKETIKDGMTQRISNIDEYFRSDERVYLKVSFLNFFKKEIYTKDNLTVLKCNMFLHFFVIFRFFHQAEKVYVHSIYYSLKTILFIKYIKNDYILDLHGVVPEENLLVGKKFQYYIYNIIEIILFKRIKYAICVTNSMKNHYIKKFPKSKTKYIIYPILPNTISESYELQINNNNNNNNTSEIRIVYSGNTQKWQNIELMSDIISRNLFPNIKYYILTGNVVEMNKIIKKNKFNSNNKQIEVLSVDPNELKTYYESCHYGFILRDDIIVNNVSCPTKMIEYMYYGLTPIVISPKIGDFKQLGYNYIKYNEVFENLKPIKSIKNHQIIDNLKTLQVKTNLREAILR